jgi:hypothetical protein
MGTSTNAWSWFRRSAVVATALAASVIVLAGSAGAGGRYTDKTGDNGAAPDLAGVDLTSDSTGQLVFRISVANFSGDVSLGLFVDADANVATGSVGARGADRAFIIDQASRTFDFATWNGFDWVDASSSTVGVSGGSAGITISVNRSELGNTSQLNFWAVTIAGDGAAGKVDLAPDAGLWNYDLAAAGPDIREVALKTVPSAGPRVGKQFSLTVTGIKLPQTNASEAILPESSTCTATLAGKKLAGIGTNGCTFRIPKKRSKGKTLLVTVTVVYQGATKFVQVPFRVKK